jgi:hypothetical protein
MLGGSDSDARSVASSTHEAVHPTPEARRVAETRLGSDRTVLIR